MLVRMWDRQGRERKIITREGDDVQSVNIARSPGNRRGRYDGTFWLPRGWFVDEAWFMPFANFETACAAELALARADGCGGARGGVAKRSRA